MKSQIRKQNGITLQQLLSMKLDFKSTKSLFDLPPNTIYLDGNSLGPPTKKASKKASKFIKKKWATLLIEGWNKDNWSRKK